MEFNTPKNFKNGKYIMNRFRKSDLMWLLLGVAITLLLFYIVIVLIVTIRISPLWLILTIIPACTSGGLVLISFPIKHNSIEVIKIIINYKLRKKYYKWEGVQHFERADTKKEN